MIKNQVNHTVSHSKSSAENVLEFELAVWGIASHAGVFRGARFSSLPTNACSTEDNIPFPCLANHIVLAKNQHWETF